MHVHARRCRALALCLLLVSLEVVWTSAVVRVTPSTVSFCLQPPAAGRIGWTPSPSMGPPLIKIMVRGLPPATDIGVFVDEGTARLAYEGAHFKTDPAGAAVVTVRAFVTVPANARRLLLESERRGTPAINATAYPCQGTSPHPPAVPSPMATSTMVQGTVAAAVDAVVGRVFIVTATHVSPNQRGSVRVLDEHTVAIVNQIAVGVLPTAIVVDEHTARAFISNAGSHSVTVLDTQRGTLLRTIQVEPHPGALAVDTRADRVFVASTGSTRNHGMVSMLDARSAQVVQTVSVPPDPIALAVDEDAGHVFVVSREGTVSMLDAQTGALLRTVAVGHLPHAVAVDARTARVFVTNIGAVDKETTPVGAGTVSVLDAHTGAVLRTVSVGTGPFTLVVAERTTRAFIINALDGSVTLLDARSGGVVRRVVVGRLPLAAAVATLTNRVFIINHNSDSVSVLDAADGHVMQTEVVGTDLAAAPSAVAIDEHTGRVFVVNATSVSVLATSR